MDPALLLACLEFIISRPPLDIDPRGDDFALCEPSLTFDCFHGHRFAPGNSDDSRRVPDVAQIDIRRLLRVGRMASWATALPVVLQAPSLAEKKGTPSL